jgi:hypothetical protein
MAQINKPSEYFNTKLYVGTSATNSVTGVGFQPDFVWIKDRDRVTYHFLFNAISGATNWLATNTTGAEQTFADTLTSFNSDGFTLGTNGDVNGSSYNFVGWSWKANGAGVSNTDGSITSTVSANTTAGFSIVSYTGTGANATVGHGLGVAPSMVICKSRTTAEGWGCYHKSLGATKLIYLNETSVPSTLSTYWQDTAPSSTVVTLGSNHAPNEIGTMIMYCFAEKKGFSKFGSYTGNGSTDGTFVYTGFKPAWLLVKRTDSARSWKLLDNKRDAYNDGTGANLNVDESGTEDDNASYAVDFLSNGFKIRNANSNFNISSGSYIYMAFAENPLVGTNNIPTTAR